MLALTLGVFQSRLQMLVKGISWKVAEQTKERIGFERVMLQLVIF